MTKKDVDWTEKYRPNTIDEVVGNQKAKKELRSWARKWKNGKPRKKAVILSGRPGIGKTTSAHALANEMRWESIEMNASDERNSEAIKNVVGRSAVDDTFSGSGKFIPYHEGKRTLIVLDEADNIFGKEDRGGLWEISKIIDRTEQPIILVANDYYDLRRRSKLLVNKLKKIDFEPPNNKDIVLLLRDICRNENIIYDIEVLKGLAERSEGDVRSAIRDLQSIALGRRSLKIEHLNVLGYRNREAEIFPTLRTILQGADPLEARDSIKELDQQPRDLITWIDENIPREYQDIWEMAAAFDKLSKADIFLGRSVTSQYYRFWAYTNDLMTAGVCSVKDSRHRGFTRYAFPTWIRKMTSSKDVRRKRKSISMKIAEYSHSTSERVRSDVLPYFKVLFNRDESFRRVMVEEMDLTKSEVAFLMDTEISDRNVLSLFERKKEEKEEVTVKVKKEKKEKKEKGDQKSLLEY